MSTKNNTSTSEIWWTSTNHGQSQIPQNWEENNPTINHYRAQPHHMSMWVHIRDTRRCFRNKQLTASKHIWRPSRHKPNTGVLPWIRLHILSGIGGYAKSSLQGFSVDESHVAEVAHHNKSVNRINRNRSWYKIGFNFYNNSSLQRTNYPSARHNDSAKVKHACTTSSS